MGAAKHGGDGCRKDRRTEPAPTGGPYVGKDRRTEPAPPDHDRVSVAELRKLSADERTAILEAQAAPADGYYRRDRQLTSFEAFGEDDLYGDGPFTEKG